MIQSYTPGQSVELVPNPHYGGVPGIPKVSATVVVNWVKTADTALLMLQDGSADSASSLPPSDFPVVQKLQSQGLVNIYNFPTFTLYSYAFNIQIDKQLETSQFGTGFNEPSNYFADLPTRLAWINAFDYAGYLNNILGNVKYGTTFGSGFQGAIPAGMIYSTPPDQLGGLPTQNLAAARGNYSISAWAQQKITIPIVVLAGDPVNLAGAEEWAETLNQISNGNINAKVFPLTSTLVYGPYMAQGSNPMAVSYQGWSPDYPDASDYAFPFYGAGGYLTSGDNLLVSNLASTAPQTANDVVYINGTTYTQDKVYGWITGNVSLGGSSVDPVVRQRAYTIATKLAIDMGLYVYIYQTRAFWFFRSWLKGYEMQENPITGGAVDLVFYWLTKE
jgi:ABC-type transport system substrate-binding protein